MSYEPGTLECRLLIEAKENILNAMKSLSNIKNTDSLHSQLRTIYNKLENMHDAKKDEESKNQI